jgi:hypothetical protein
MSGVRSAECEVRNQSDVSDKSDWSDCCRATGSKGREAGGEWRECGVGGWPMANSQ